MSTSIEWTDATWNPVRGCSVVSEGCRNCYAMKQAHRFSGHGEPYEGLTELGPQGPRWNGKIKLVQEVLNAPLRWRKPKRIFVNSMSDLFHEEVPTEFIQDVWARMCIADHHTYQILTKRPKRMHDWLTTQDWDRVAMIVAKTSPMAGHRALTRKRAGFKMFEHVWLGVSIEDQKTADERIPILLQTSAGVRFVSAEPLLGPVDLAPWLRATTRHHFRADVEGMLRNRSFAGLQHDDGRPMSRQEAENELFALHAKGVKYIPASSCDAFDPEDGCKGHPEPRLDWVIAGGESGPGSRPCDVAWIRSIVEQCKAAAVPCFVKQLGANPYRMWETRMGGMSGAQMYDEPEDLLLGDRKGGDPAEWPADLRVREWPK